MDWLLIVTRALHFAAGLSLAGIFGFTAFIAADPSPRLTRQLRIGAWLSAALLLLTAPVWLILVAESMSADPLRATIASGAARTVLIDTQFGHALGLRLVLTLLLLPAIMRLGQRRAIDLAASLLAAVSLAGIAWQGHAGGDVGRDAVIHLAADASHLVAAGLWLGALLPLTFLLLGESDARKRYEAAKRFSTLGVICVGALLLSGIVNGYYLVGSIPALIGTAYGQALLLKLAFVAVMLALAGINRWRLVPCLAAGDSQASRRLARHAAIEAGLGLVVIAIVAALGTMIPAAHQAIVWPFAWRFSLDALASDPDLRADALFSGLSALLGLGCFGIGLYLRHAIAIAIGCVIAFGLGTHATELVLLPATSASYQVSPEPFDVASIAAGDALFQQRCAACHGTEGEGDGPLAAQSPIPPADLMMHLPMHPEGDLFSFITDGIDNGVMPSFAAIPASQRWDIILALQARYEAKAAMSTLLAQVTALPTPRAPDFALPQPQGQAGTLSALLQRQSVLLVFATLPQSEPRLNQLRQWREPLADAGVTVVTITQSPDIRAAYALYERRPQIDTVPSPHLEFLIDRTSHIRARWRPGDTPDWTQLAALEREIAASKAMPPIDLSPAMPAGHVHEG